MATTGKPIPHAKLKKQLIEYLSDKRIKINEFTIQNDIRSRALDDVTIEQYDTGFSTIYIDLERKINKKRDLINKQ